MDQQLHTDLDSAADRAADYLKALANPWRLRILCTLAEGPLAVGVLAQRIGAIINALYDAYCGPDAPGARESR
jgi:DNA-binding transcriptional ArsR family regulator